MFAYNPSTKEIETRGFGDPWLYRESEADLRHMKPCFKQITIKKTLPDHWDHSRQNGK